jgi:hypothetical protein
MSPTAPKAAEGCRSPKRCGVDANPCKVHGTYARPEEPAKLPMQCSALRRPLWPPMLALVDMNGEIERNLGEQPLARILREHGLKSHDLVASSTDQITHKMVARAGKGRRLTPNVQAKILKAVNAATGKLYTLRDLFNY